MTRSFITNAVSNLNERGLAERFAVSYSDGTSIHVENTASPLWVVTAQLQPMHGAPTNFSSDAQPSKGEAKQNVARQIINHLDRVRTLQVPPILPPTIAPPTPPHIVSGKLLHHYLPVSLFISNTASEYKCMKCGGVPLEPVTPQCCGTIFCAECYQPPSTTLCNMCNSPFKPAIVPTYLVSLIISEQVRCLNYSFGCQTITPLGKNGSRLLEHVNQCPYSQVICPGCKKMISHHEFAAHRGDAPVGSCQYSLITCDVCDVIMPHHTMKNHEDTPAHRQGMMVKLSSLIVKVSKMETMMNNVTQELKETKQELAQSDEKIRTATVQLSQSIQVLQSAQVSKWLEVTINGWSLIRVKSLSEPTSMFSALTPLRAWGREWWLKVDKALDGYIGLYLCCGVAPTPTSVTNIPTVVATPTSVTNIPVATPAISITNISTNWPIICNYQLMTRQRGTDNAVCCTNVFRTEFGVEHAWGLSQFSTLEVLERAGAYSLSEDKITFGCIIYPIKGMRWGQTIDTRRTMTQPSPNENVKTM